MLPPFLEITRRMDWGFGNPNKTGSLIAMLLVATWLLPAIVARAPAWVREIAWWLALLGSAALGVCLLLTGSRGSAVAAGAGLFAMAVFAQRTWRPRENAPLLPPRRRIVAGAVFCIALLVLAFLIPQASRFSPVFSAGDASIGNRWLIWREIPAMIAAAPAGWGLGNSGDIFMTWFQLDERSEMYRTLVNSHGTWLVEFGWLGRIGYVFGWALAFCLAWPSRIRGAAADNAADDVRRLPSWSLAVVIVFALTALFSSVAEVWQLWIPFGTAIAAMLFVRWRNKCWPNKKTLLRAVALPTFSILALLWGIGSITGNLHISNDGNTAKIGSGKPRFLVLVNPEIGKGTARQLRVFCKQHSSPPTILWTTVLPKEKPGPDVTVAVVGLWESDKLAPFLENAKSIVLFSPQFGPDELPQLTKSQQDGKAKSGLSVYYGEFATGSAHIPEWTRNGHCEVLPGMSNFIHDWPELMMQVHAKKTRTTDEHR